MTKKKKSSFWHNREFGEISALFIALVFLVSCFGAMVDSYAAADYMIVFGECLDGNTVKHDFDILYSSETAPEGSSEDWTPDVSSYSWTPAPNTATVLVPSISNDYYAYKSGYTSGYMRGLRIYFSYLGDTAEVQLSFIGLPYSTIDYFAGNLDDLFYNNNLELYNLGTDGNWYKVPHSAGVDGVSYDDNGNRATYSGSVQAVFESVYAYNAAQYEYNYYVEFHFTPVEARYGWAYNDGSYASDGLKFWLDQRTADFLSITPFMLFLGDTISGMTTSLFEYHTTFPIADFVSAGKTSFLFTQNLPNVLNPFMGIFVGNGINQVWAYLCTFSLGMYLLSVVVGYLRRESGHFKGGKK